MNDITVLELKERLDKGENLMVIDVREPHEYEEYNIGGILIPLGDLPKRYTEMADYRDEEIIVHCRSGKRSEAAKHFLMQNGYTKVRNLLGGMIDWQMHFGK